jgi:hypothetical protein
MRTRLNSGGAGAEARAVLLAGSARADAASTVYEPFVASKRATSRAAMKIKDFAYDAFSTQAPA